MTNEDAGVLEDADADGFSNDDDCDDGNEQTDPGAIPLPKKLGEDAPRPKKERAQDPVSPNRPP